MSIGTWLDRTVHLVPTLWYRKGKDGWPGGSVLSYWPVLPLTVLVLSKKPACWCQHPVLICRGPGRLYSCSSEQGGFLNTIKIQPCSASCILLSRFPELYCTDFPAQSSLQWQSYDSPGSFWDSQAFPSKSLHPLQPIFKCLAYVLKCWYWTKCKYSATSSFNLGLDPPFIVVKCNKKER